MPEKKKVTEFQRLLRIAIGAMRSQTDFGRDSGISVSQINRLLNRDDNPRPNANTMRRIADASNGRVTVEQLAYAWDHPEKAQEESAEQGRGAFDFGRKQRDNLMEGLKRFSGIATAHKSIPDVLETVTMLYLDKDVEFLYQKQNENGKYAMSKEFHSFDIENIRGHKNAEKVANVVAKWEDEYASYFLAFTLFFCETTNGAVILSDVAFDLQTLLDYEHMEGIRLVMHVSEKENANISDYAVVDGIRLKSKGKDEVSPERRLLKAIFGWKDDEVDAEMEKLRKEREEKRRKAAAEAAEKEEGTDA